MEEYRLEYFSKICNSWGGWLKPRFNTIEELEEFQKEYTKKHPNEITRKIKVTMVDEYTAEVTIL